MAGVLLFCFTLVAVATSGDFTSPLLEVVMPERYENSAVLLRLSKSVLVNRLLDCGLELEDALERIAELEQCLLDADWELERVAVSAVDRFVLEDGRVGQLIDVLDRVTVDVRDA